MRKEQLFDHLGWLTTPKDFATICQKPTPGIIQSYLRRSKCEEYHHFGAMRWTDLHDFGPLLPHIRIQFHDIVSLEHLQRQLKVSDDDTYVHTDEQLYDWRLYDNVKEANNLLKENANYIDSFAGRRYYKVYTLKQWQKHDEKLLYLGGVFGSNRLSLTDPNHVALKTLIADTLKYRRDTPLGETVRNIVDYLGGVGTFMSVHFRTGDRPFRIRLHENLLTFIKGMANLTDVALPETDAELLNVELTNAPATEMPLFDMETLPWSALCRRLKERDTLASLQSQAMMYIATDHMHPRAEDSQLRPWFKYFPCTITLGDLPDHLFTPLDKVRDLVDPEKGLRPFLIPLVDAMVAAHAKEIFTTPRSTFSRYIGELHNAWLA
ncbi:uncharacterized protein BYT42DRAFT_595480 [Radiomyces spectabilis]|uniref:uncharacterized protein n=1 Tax=Radiomyces spectabilis TaxID=64574 RepID=UPI00222068A6|nr:uncharacterized protein BYT42DRAFT_595480 [Radiomyces spectabilis]KAI8369478.1 hypothetical protein BYT42DRAFT_595480 [Radiomyces spectabilis]